MVQVNQRRLPRGASRPWRRGMRVRVKSRSAIQATLDDQGACDRLLFTAEMWQYCGQVFEIATVVNRIYIEKGTVRALPDTVMLDGIRCDGQAHGDCHRSCTLLFKMAWVEPIDGAASGQSRDARSAGSLPPAPAPCQGRASVLENATAPLPFWQPRQYLADLRDGRLRGRALLRMFWTMLRFRLNRGRPVRPRAAAPPAPAPPPVEILGLQPGELVEVRGIAEITATLDAHGKYRGLYFSPEGMAPCCGKQFRVLRRVERIIDEVTEQPVTLTHTVYLEGVVCDGIGLRGCPRQCYWLWREAWLKRVE